MTGQVTVTNPAPKIANLTAFTATLGATPLGLVSCTGTAGQVGAAGSKVCSFSLPLPDGSTRVGTARGVVATKAYTGSATINFANAVVTKINETSVDVTDTMTETASVRHFPGMTDGDSEHYQIDVCENVDWQGENSFGYTLVNTARIDQPTNDSDTETVDVTCLRPDNITVTKTFIGSYDVDYNWEVTKTVNSPLNLFVGETGTFTWTIDVEKSDPIYSGTPKWRVDVTNEEEFGATVTVDDSLDGLVCPQAQDARSIVGNVFVAGGATVTCYLTGTTFSGLSTLPVIPVNTVVITTVNGVTATASVQGVWSGEPKTVTDSTVDVVDSNGRSWNDVSDDKSFPVSYTESEVGCFSQSVTWHQDHNSQTGIGSGERNNTVQVRTNEEEFSILDQDDATGIVNCYEIVATSTCVADAPVLSWILSGPNAGSISNLKLEWMNGNGGGATVLPGGSIPGLPSSGQRLWLGANTANGSIGSTGIQWPGWTQNGDGSWSFTPNSVNPTANVRFSFNPTSGIKTVAYPPAFPTCSTAPRATIGDRVWNDKNANGIQDPGETGVAGVLVTLKSQHGSNNLPDLTTTTDASGIYTFTNLIGGDVVSGSVTAPINYVVQFALPTGFTRSPQNIGNDADDSDPNVATGFTDAFTVDAGAVDKTHDSGVFQASIAIDKRTKFDDGDTHLIGDGIAIPYLSENVSWVYTVTNTSGMTLVDVVVTDDKVASISCPKDTLAPNESMVCTATGSFTNGDYSNTGVVTGTIPAPNPGEGDPLPPLGKVTDSDPSNYSCVGNILTGIVFYDRQDRINWDRDNNRYIVNNAPVLTNNPSVLNMATALSGDLMDLNILISLSKVVDGVEVEQTFQQLQNGRFYFDQSLLDPGATYTLHVEDGPLQSIGFAPSTNDELAALQHRAAELQADLPRLWLHPRRRPDW